MILARLRPALALPVVLLALFAASAATLLIVTERQPVVESVEPAIVSSGDIVSITGEHFGNERGNSYVTVAGRRLTASSYLRWSEHEIGVRIPEFVESGLLEVHTNHGSSEGVLLRHTEGVPVTAGEHRLRPEVDRVSTRNPAIGDILVIHGSNFGRTRGNGVVEFTGVDGLPVHPAAEEQAYEKWAPGEIQVRVPPEAASGPVYLRTSNHDSQIADIEVRRVGGTLSIRDTRTMIVERNIRLNGLQANASNGMIHLWMPAATDRVHQRAPDVLSRTGPSPLSALDRMKLYEWRSDQWGSDGPEYGGMRWNAVFQRRTIVTQLSEGSVRTDYDTANGLYTRYTAEREGLPVTAETVVSFASPAAANNPLSVARNVWNWMRGNVAFEESGSDDVIEVLESGSGSAAGISDTFTTMLRANSVPARPVRGALAVDAAEMPFYSWAEFYLDGFGWVPADLARTVGAGSHYFSDSDNTITVAPELGEIDNRVIEFRAGIPKTPQLHPDGDQVRMNGVYSPHTVLYETYGVTLESVELRNPDLLGQRTTD